MQLTIRKFRHKVPLSSMLSEAFYVQENSRLGCQLQLTPNMDGLEIELAPES